jgi:hypothetical protein
MEIYIETTLACLSWKGSITHVSVFCTYWVKFYDYPLEHLYLENIEKRSFSPEQLRDLYRWKNGMNFSGKKAKVVEELVKCLPLINDLKQSWDFDLFPAKI